MIFDDLSVNVKAFGTEFFVHMERPDWSDIIRRRNDSNDILNAYVIEEVAANDLVNAFSAYDTGGEWGVTNHRNYFYYLKHAVSRACRASTTAAMFIGLSPIMIDGFPIVVATDIFIGILRKIAEHCPDTATRAYALEQVKLHDKMFGEGGGMEL